MNRLQELMTSIGVFKSSWDTIFTKNLDINLDQHSVLKEPYRSSELVYICISYTAKAIAQIPLQVMKGDEVLPDNDPWVQLFSRPNLLMDKVSFVEAMVSYLLLDGNVWMIPFPPSNTTPDSIWVVNQNSMRPNRNKRTGQLDGWKFVTGLEGAPSDGIELLPEEVCHAWLWNPYDPIMGMAPLDAGKISIRTDYKAAVYNENFFDQGGSPAGILSTDQRLGNKEFARLQSQMGQHEGFLKSNKLMILEKGLQYTQKALSHKDMEWIEGRGLSAERVYQIFGMKKAIISAESSGDGLNSNRAKEQRRSWWQDTNIPLMTYITSALTFSVLRKFGLWIRFDKTAIDALQEELKEKLETATLLKALGFTTNEINDRLELGFDEKPWRDEWWHPMSEVSESRMEEEDPDDDDDEPDDVPEDDEEIEEDMITLSKDWEPKAERVWKNLVNGTLPIEKWFAGKLRKIFYDMRKKSLEVLGNEKTVTDLEKEDFIDETKRIQVAANRASELAIMQGVKTLVDEVGFDLSFNLSDPNAINYLATKELQVTKITQRIKGLLNDELSAGMSAGESIGQISNRIKEVFNKKISGARAKTIARTEVVGAANFGRSGGIEESGFKQRRWFTALDERVRSGPLYNHQVMHGKVAKVGEPWVTPGGSLRYPGDYSGRAGNIINCRCVEVIVPGSNFTGSTNYAIDEEVEEIRDDGLKSMSKERVKGNIQSCY